MDSHTDEAHKKVLYLQGISGLTMQEGLSSPSGKGALSPTHKKIEKDYLHLPWRLISLRDDSNKNVIIYSQVQPDRNTQFQPQSAASR